MIRSEIDVLTGERRTISTALYMVGDVAIYVDENQPTPPGAVLVTSAPAQQPQAPGFSILEFLDLFTEAEQLVIVEASMQSAPIKLWYDKTLAASFVTITDPRVSAGLSALVSAGLLSEQRMGEIVAAMSA